MIRHNDDVDEFHLDLFDPVCLHHEISAEHNLVIMVFSTPWMMLNHARAYNSGVPVQLVYDATGSITDCAGRDRSGGLVRAALDRPSEWKVAIGQYILQ